jgi:hypothetical protein
MLIVTSDNEIKKLKAVEIYQIEGGSVGILLTLGSSSSLFTVPTNYWINTNTMKPFAGKSFNSLHLFNFLITVKSQIN